MLHELLWQSAFGVAQRCLEHPFLRGLRDGTLEPSLFRAYIAQDAYFLRAFLKAYALVLARSEDPEAAGTLVELMGGVLEELKLHGGYAVELGIDLDRVVPLPACRAYTDFLLSTAWHASAAETLAAMAPCMRLYAHLGAELAARTRKDNPYRRWIETYGSAEFEALARRLEVLLDRVASDTGAVRDRYRYAMDCELAFFEDSVRHAADKDATQPPLA